MAIDRSKLQRMYKLMADNGYTQDYNTFEKKFSGNSNYANRKAVYDLFTKNGADLGGSYEEFMRKLQKPRATKPQQQPKTALGRAQQSVARQKWGGGVVTHGNTTAYESASAPMENDSELVRGLKNANAVQRLQAPVSYTKPGAVKQMVKQTRDRQHIVGQNIEQAGRQFTNRERDRRNAPAFDLGNEDVNNNIVKTRGQLEDELEESSRQLVDKQLGGYINNSIQKMFKDATVKGVAAEDALSKASPFAYMAAGKAYNEALDPDKLMNQLSKNAEKDMTGLFSDPKMQKEIAEKADSLGIDPEDYVKNYIAPGLQAKIAEEFEKSELSRNMPKSTAEYIIRGVNDSMIGTILSMGMMSKKQRQYAQQGMAMTDNGENPYVKPGMGARVARGTLSFAADAPVFGALGKAGAAVAGKVMGNGVAQAARIANTTLRGRIVRMAAAGAVSQGVTGVLYGSTNAAVQNYSTGDDTSIGNTVKLMTMGGLSEGASWATMGGIGGAVGAGIYNVSGVKRIPAKVFQIAMEGWGMHVGGNVAKMIEGHDTDFWSVEGTLEACANVVALKLTHARLPNRYTKDGKKESYLDMVKRNLANLMVSDGQRASFGGYTFTNEEKEQLFGSNKAPLRKMYERLIEDMPLRPEGFTHWALRTKKTTARGKGEESYKDTDAEFVKTAYDEIMADNTIPWDTKAKFSALVMGTVPSSRPMMEYIGYGGGTISEYSKYGELLSEHIVKTEDERDSVVYSLRLRRENQRLSNAYGAAQIKDEKTAQETLETVAETFGFTAEQLKAAMDKDPLKRSEEEQNACVALRKAYEGEQFPEGTLHPDQSQTEGKDVVEENNLGTENPNNEAVDEVLNNMKNAEKAFNAALESNDVLKQEYERLTKEGLSEPQIYMELFNSGLTQEQLAPFADYINAKAKAVGMYRGTEQKIAETVQKHVEQWSYKGELNGEKQEGGQMLFVKDNNGRLLIVGAGDVAFDSEGRARENVGDMLSVLDPNTKEMDFVSKKDVQLDHVEKTEDYAKNYQEMLEVKNSEVYAQNEQQKQMENAAGGVSPEGGKPNGEEGVKHSYTLGEKKAGNGEPFYQDESGNIDLATIPDEVFEGIGYTKAPFRLTPSMIKHMLDRHNKELGFKDEGEAINFVVDVMNNFDHVRLGYDGALVFSIENGRKRTGKRAVTVLINSDNGEFYGLKTSGYEGIKGLEKRPLLWERGANESSSTDAASASVTTGKSPISGGQSGSASHQGNSLHDKDSNNPANGNGNNETLTFADGSPVPMMKDSKGRETADYSQMTPEQGAEWMSSQFGENAEAAVDGQIKRAEKMLKESEKIKVDYTGDLNDAKEAEAQKAKAVDAAKAELELYTNIKKVMTANKVKAGIEKVGAVGEEGSVSEAGDLGAVREKFESGKRIVGNKRTRTLADGSKLRGHYEIVEADSLTPSHNANDGYKKSEGFPVNEEGRTINDRDYENDKQAQLVTDMIAMKYDGQAVDQVPVVTSDGIVVDGNGRTMAGQKAAKNGTDGAYLEALKENAENYGFTAEQIEQSGIKHPRLVLVSDEPMKYDTATFAKFNKNEKKTQGNTQQAVAQSKKLSADEISTIVAEIEGSGSLDAFFNNPTAINSLLKRLIDKGVIGLNEVAGLREGEDKLSAAGKDFVKNLLLGSVFSENTIRMMGADAMLKTKALNGIRAVTDNMKLGDYALMKEIDQAVQLLYEARQGGSGVDAYLRTPAMFGENAADRYDPISQAIALALEGKVEDFRELMMAYNRNAAHYADANQTEMFGEKPTMEEFINEFLKLRNWKDYETRHSNKEGNGDAGSTQGSEPETSGENEQTEGEGFAKSGDKTLERKNIGDVSTEENGGPLEGDKEDKPGNDNGGSPDRDVQARKGQREVDKAEEEKSDKPHEASLALTEPVEPTKPKGEEREGELPRTEEIEGDLAPQNKFKAYIESRDQGLKQVSPVAKALKEAVESGDKKRIKNAQKDLVEAILASPLGHGYLSSYLSICKNTKKNDKSYNVNKALIKPLTEVIKTIESALDSALKDAGLEGVHLSYGENGDGWIYADKNSPWYAQLKALDNDYRNISQTKENDPIAKLPQITLDNVADAARIIKSVIEEGERYNEYTEKEELNKEPLSILPKKEENTLNPIVKAAENYKKDHPLTEEEIRSSDVDDIAKDMAVDYLNGEVTDDLHRAVYESIYEKVKDAKMKNATKQADNKTETTETPKVEASASPIEGMKNAAEKFAKEKEAAAEAMGEVKKPQQKADDAAVEASNKKVNDLWNDLLKAGREDLSASFIGLNARQLEVLPKLVSAMAENAYLRIKRGMHNLEDVVKEMRKEFAPAAQVFKKEDVDAIYEQMMNIRYRDGEQRMSLKEWADYYEKTSPKYQENLVGDSKEAEDRKVSEKKFIDAVKLQLAFGRKIKSIIELRKIAERHGLKDIKDTDLQELAEAAIVMKARGIASSESTNNTEKFKRIKKLYENQPSLNQRDSERVMKQQYSTPAPYAFLADMYVKAGIEVKSALEPSAGNGMLTIGLPKDAVHVNDIDAQRLANLQRQGFKNVTSQDGTQPFADKDVDVVVTNPPFGSATPRDYDGYTISSLEGQMAINALESMKDNGRAAIIIGGKTEYAKNGSLNPKDKALLGFLYSHYNVEDVINVDGSLYAKQGTTYPTRIILINGRRFDENAYPPVKDKARAEAVKSYDELYKRINDDILRSGRMDSPVGEGGEDANAKPNRPSVADVNEEGVRAGGNGGGEQKPSVRTGGVHDKTAEPVSDNVLGTEGGTKPGENGGLPDGATGANGAGTEPTSSKEPTTGTNKQRGNEPGGNGRPNTQPNADETTDAGNGGRPRGQLERVDKPVRGLSAEKVTYAPRSENPFTLKAVMPADQQEAVNKNLEKLGDADQFLVDELGYNDKADLYAHLAAEQVDSVALALQQAKKGNAFIIGDMTGIGKGRQAASLIRYAKKQGQVPVYFTKTAGLLSDVYRDLVDIGSKELRPFVFGSAKEAAITDADGNVVFALPSKNEVKRVLDYIEKNGELPKEYDYVLTTYSQVSNGVYEFDENGNRKERKLAKGKKFGAAAISGQARRDAIEKLMKNGYLILDESHTAGGDSGQGNYFQHIIQKAKNVTFFSATFAKRPDNMPIYALRTAMNQGGLKASDLIDAVKRGGATLQEIMSQALTQCGQMIRRERDMTGVTIDWKAIDDPEVVAEQREQYDSIIGLFNDIINFQRTYVSAYVDRRNEELAEVQSSMGIKRGTEALGIKNQPFASKAFNTVQQVLLSLKAKSAAERAIDYLKQGMKPVIALNNTNESQTGNLALGEEMDAPDLGTSLKKGLEGTLRYTSKNAKDESESGYINLKDLGADAVEAYHALEEKIRKTSTGLSLSPIDVIKNELTKAGYKVGELTGRQTEFVYNENGTVTKVKRADTDKKKLAREFNDGQIDALILNKSAATGISLHASSKYADQRKRVMIVAQQQLDVNDEVQMRGRIDRTGQVARGAYEYVVSLIPAEQRLLMMFKAKLKSLDANTTSSQKSKFNEMEVADITNKYGDKVVKEYMAEHLDLYARMADPFGWEKSYGADLSTIDPQKLVSSSDGMNSEAGGDASKLLGRMALLKVKEQEKMLQEIGDLYAAEIQRLNEMGENDLEITELPLKAKTINKGVWKEGSEPGGDNAFADNTYVEKVNMAVLKKPMKAEEVKKAQDGLTGGKSWDEYKKEKKKAIEDYFINKAKEEGAKIEERARKAAAKAREKYLKDALRNQKNSGMTDEQIAQMAIYQQDNIYKVENEKGEEVVKNLKAKAEMFYRILETFNTEDAFVLPTDMNNPAELSGFGNSYGRLIDIKITDNFSPNASTVSFATLDGRRKITFPINGKAGLGSDKADVIGIIDRLTRQASAMGDNHLRVLSMDTSNWDKLTSNESRKDGYIITGNLLQALIDTKEQGLGGQLVKYTTDTGDVKTGILMPGNFEPNGLANEKPINSVAEKFELPSNKGGITEVTSSDGDVKIEQGFDYMKMARNYTIRVPKSNKKGGKYFLDKELLKMVDGGNFETRGNTMLAEVKEEKLKDVLDRLSELGVKVKEESKVHYRMELGDTFSDSKEHFDAVRDRAVEEKGIVMPNLNKEKVKVVEVEKSPFGNNIETSLKNAREWARENLVTMGKTEMPTMRDGTPYIISKRAVEKYLSESAVRKSENLDIHLSVLPKLTDVIHESIEAEIHADYNVKDETGKRKAELGYGNNILVHRLYGAVEMDGKIYRVKTTMQEFRGGEENKPHSYEVTKIELLDSPGKRENPDRPPLVSSNNSIDNKIELPDTPGTAVLPDSSPLDMTPSNSKNITSEGSEKANESDSLPLNSTTNGYISTAKLLQGVEKSYDSGKKLLDESKNLTDGETFFRKEGDGVVTPEKTSGTSNAVSERIIKTVEKVAKRTGGKVKMVNSVEEIENPKVRKDIENGKQVTGWYDEKTGEVHLYMPNIHDSYTAEKTVWHETVGHKGMRGLLGDKFNDYMRGLWMDLDNPINAELRAYVKEKMNMNHLGFYDAIEEFIAKSAEDGKGEPGFWNYIKNKVTDALHEIGYRVSPNVKDVKYMLWLAKNVQKHGDSPLWKMRAEAVRWKIEHEKTEYTKIEGGELYDNDGKSHDFESMSREEWLEATDGEIHYRTAPNAATALDRYHHALDRHSYMATEAFMDNMLSLKKLMEAIDPSIRKIEDVNSSMNPYLMQNITEGMMSDKSKLFEIRYMDPLSKAMSSVLDSFDGKKVEDRIRNFNLYMIRKHGLERNRVLFVRDWIKSEKRKGKSEESDSIDALETAWKDERSDLRQKLDSGQIDLKEYYRQMDEWIVQNLDKDFKAEEHDYSGMHGLQGIDDMKSPYDDAGAIDEVMSQEASMESMKKGSVADFWKKVKAATDYSVNSDYENNIITKETHDGVLNMFDWYVPLRKFDEATAEDVYGYVTEMGDPSNYIGTTLMNAKGRKSLSNVEILAQIGLMGNRAIRNGGQNSIKLAFARFVRNSGEQNLVKETKVWVEKTGTDLNGNDIWEEAYPQIPEGASADDVASIVDAFETDMRTKQAKGEAKSLSNGTDIGFKFQRAKDKSQHFVDVKIAGRTHRFVVLGNPRAAQALNGMLENGKASVRSLQAVTRWMAMASTSWSPEFVMRNIVRDMEFASSHVAAKEGGRYLAKWSRYYGELNPLNMFYNEGAGSLKSMKMKDFKNGVGFGLYARYREGTLGNSKMERYFKEFMENGGETGFVQLFSMHDMEKSYKSIVEKESAKGAKKVMVNAVEVLKKLGENVENLNEVAENMARFATYCTSRDLGRSAARSAYDAKEVSTNFNRHGSGDAIKSFKNGEMGDWQKARRNTYGFVAGYLRNYSMFFNAGIQSTNLLFKNIKRAPVGTTVAMTSAPFALALIMAAVNNAIIQNEDDKDRGNVKDPYGELPDYIRRNNLCIYVGNNKFVTVPLAIELRAFYSLGDLAAGQTFAKNVKSQRNMAMDAVGCMSQLFPVMDFSNNPNYEKSLENGVGMTTEGIAPTAIVPFIEWWLNNDWKGAPIRRTGDKTELNPAWQNAYNNVPARLVDLNKWVNAKTNNIAPGNPEMKGNEVLDWATDPSMLNHFFGSWSGGMGTFTQRTAGLVAKATTGKTDEIEVGDVPFLRSLFYTPREQSSMARTKAKWYNYKEEMEQTIANNDKLKSKNVPTMKRIENAAALEKFEGSPEQRKVNIIKNAEKRMRHWNTMRKKWADDKKQVDFANKNIEMIMQEAVEDLDRIE